jgi:3-phenylpropionate/cinnamic acid dioxygenase small subunit
VSVAPVADPELLAAWTERANRLLALEAFLLDSRRYEEWIELFEDDGLYWIPLDRSSTDGGESLNIAFEGPPRLRQRVARLRSGIAHAQEPPSSTVHSYSSVLVEDVSPAAAIVRSALLVVHCRFGDQLLVAARCEHRLIARDGGVSIAQKRVDLADVDQAQNDLSFVL